MIALTGSLIITRPFALSIICRPLEVHKLCNNAGEMAVNLYVYKSKTSNPFHLMKTKIVTV